MNDDNDRTHTNTQYQQIMLHMLSDVGFFVVLFNSLDLISFVSQFGGCHKHCIMQIRLIPFIDTFNH